MQNKLKRLQKYLIERSKHHHTGRLKSRFELLLAASTALLALILVFFLFSRNYQLQAPAILHNFLKTNHIELSETLFESKLFPIPHFYAPQIELYIDHQVLLQLKGVQLSPDYLALLTQNYNQIKTIYVKHATLRVMPPEIRSVASLEAQTIHDKPLKERVMDEIVKITHIVVRQFLIARRFTLDRFDLFVEQVDSLNPLLSVQDFLLKREDHIYLNLKTNMANWLFAEIAITAFLKEASQPRTKDPLSHLSHVMLEIQHHYQLEKIGEAYSLTPFLFSGTGKGILKLHIPLPLEEIEGFFETIPQTVKIGSLEEPFLVLRESDKIKISFPFTTNRDYLTAKEVKLQIGNTIWPASLKWDYQNFNIVIQFPLAKKSALPGDVVALILGSYFKPFLEYITTAKSFIQPNFISIFPLKKQVQYQGNFLLQSRMPHKESQMGGFALTGFISGNQNVLQSSDLTLRGEATAIHMKNFQLILSRKRTLTANIEGEIYLADFYRGSKGKVSLKTTIYCHTGDSIDCKHNPFSLWGSEIQIPVNQAARFYRLLSIDIFSYWKSLKKTSEITISKLSLQGTIERDKLYIEKSLIDSDTGRIQLTGEYILSQETGNFILRLMPFGVDRVLEPIPMVGSAIHSSLSYAVQMIYQVRYKNKKFEVSQFTIGRGLEKLRNVFAAP